MKKSLIALGAVAVIALLIAVALYGLASSNVFRSYDLATGEWSGGVSPAIAFIPLAVAVIAGIGALVFWLVGSTEVRRAKTSR